VIKVIPCSDGAGEVVAIGDGVSKWSKGDRVMGTSFLFYRHRHPLPTCNAPMLIRLHPHIQASSPSLSLLDR
jgi:NADPH:quinone reductase-like Zn-dependent oxidoreductase